MIRVLDLAIFWYLNSWAGASKAYDALIIFCAQYLGYLCVAAFFLLLFFWRRSQQEKISIFWVAVASVVIARLGVTEFIRFFYHRPRPFIAHHVHQLISETEWSFPSGHAAFFFALAAAVYLYDKKWGMAFFAASVAMGIGRVAAGVHYPSDILGGMLIGAVVACVVFYFVEIWQQGKVSKI